jgi:phosphoribosyl 1,2-cyclic phosphodiesterase
MKITFHGVRGSYPVAAPHAMRYGGNTPCLEIEAGATCIVIDAGTGICALGRRLVERGVRHIHLLLSHTHWDHIQGFPHFTPLYREEAYIRVYGLRRQDRSLGDILRAQQQAPFFPLPLEQAPARLEFIELEEGQQLAVGEAQVLCHRLNHPSVTGGFRLEHQGRALAYVCDADLYGPHLLGEGMDQGSKREQQRRRKHLQNRAGDLAHRADLVVCDTFFLPEEYKPDWGHSRPDDALRLARGAGARRVALFHHEPHRSDERLDQVQQEYQRAANGHLEVLAAAEGMEVVL